MHIQSKLWLIHIQCECKQCASRYQKSAMPGSIVSAKVMHISLTSKHKIVRNVSVDIMYLLKYI